MLYTSGMLAKVPKIAVASSSYEQRVCDKHYQKNLRRRLRLERVADGRLVIPRWVRIVCVLLLYCDVVCIEVCFGAVHTLDQDVHDHQVRIVSRARQHGFPLEFCRSLTLL